jgi:hypothetical protein
MGNLLVGLNFCVDKSRAVPMGRLTFNHLKSYEIWMLLDLAGQWPVQGLVHFMNMRYSFGEWRVVAGPADHGNGVTGGGPHETADGGGARLF